MPSKTVPVAAVEQLRRTFGSAPACRAEEVTLIEAIRMLVPEIHGMQQKGYGLGAIARYFADQGLAVTEGTLKNYLQRVKASGGRKAKRKDRAPRVGPEVSTAGTGVAQATASPGSNGAPRPTTPAPSPATTPLAAPEPPKVARRPPENVPVRRSSFVPKEDTEDL